jgi:hypothetical protein
MEGIGLILVLGSSFIQLTETSIESDIQEQKSYQTQEKLDYLWHVLAADYAKRHPEEGISASINFKHYYETYKIYDQNRDEINKWQGNIGSKAFTNWRVWLFFIGSIILILPKLIRIKE